MVYSLGLLRCMGLYFCADFGIPSGFALENTYNCTQEYKSLGTHGTLYVYVGVEITDDALFL